MNRIVDQLVYQLDHIVPSSSSSSIFEERFPEVIARSRETSQTVHRIAFTYFPVFPTPVVTDRIDRSLDPLVTTREFIESLIRIIPLSLSTEDVMTYSANFFVKFFAQEPRLAKQILLLMCVVGTIKLTSETSCNGLLARASEIRICSENQAGGFKLRISDLEKIEVWFVCEYLFNNRGIIV